MFVKEPIKGFAVYEGLSLLSNNSPVVKSVTILKNSDDWSKLNYDDNPQSIIRIDSLVYRGTCILV